MKIRNTPITDRLTDDPGLVAKYKTFRQKPTWIKIRRFFWAVGVVLWDSVLAVGEAATESDAGREKENARVLHSREAEDIYGNPQ